MRRLLIIPIIVSSLVFSQAPARAADTAADAREIVEKGRMTLDKFMADKDFSAFQENLKKAKGVLIFPQVLRAGYIWGGSGGSGLLLMRDEKTSEWSQPAFYIIGSVSFGLQIGAETAEVVMLAMSRKASGSLMTSSFKLGGDISVAAGPAGKGFKKIVTADFISFARTKGLYAGLNFEGSMLKVGDDLNKAYYGKEVRPVQILVEKEVKNPHSDDLRKSLSRVQE